MVRENFLNAVSNYHITIQIFASYSLFNTNVRMETVEFW